MTEQTVGIPAAVSAPAPVTGDDRVDAVLARLDRLEQRDLPDQVAAFSDVQTGLAAILDEPLPDDRPEPGPARSAAG